MKLFLINLLRILHTIDVKDLIDRKELAGFRSNLNFELFA